MTTQPILDLGFLAGDLTSNPNQGWTFWADLEDYDNVPPTVAFQAIVLVQAGRLAAAYFHWADPSTGDPTSAASLADEVEDLEHAVAAFQRHVGAEGLRCEVHEALEEADQLRNLLHAEAASLADLEHDPSDPTNDADTFGWFTDEVRERVRAILAHPLLVRLGVPSPW